MIEISDKFCIFGSRGFFLIWKNGTSIEFSQKKNLDQWPEVIQVDEKVYLFIRSEFFEFEKSTLIEYGRET